MKKILKKYAIYLIDNRFTPYFFLIKVKYFCKINKKNILLNKRNHNLPKKLIISLTSYRKRFSTLDLTLKCLLFQSIQPDKLVLWVAHNEIKSLPEKVTKLIAYGLEIKSCDDIRSYKKVIPAINQYKNSFIVTADDDIYYWKTWLEELIRPYNSNKKEVISYRSRIVLNKNNHSRNISTYKKWKINLIENTSNLNFFTGCGGVLYPPESLRHADISNIGIFTSLSPYADDIWLNWMIRLNGYSVRNIGGKHKFYSWPSSQKESLTEINVTNNQNDKQICKMINYYGNIFLDEK